MKPAHIPKNMEKMRKNQRYSNTTSPEKNTGKFVKKATDCYKREQFLSDTSPSIQVTSRIESEAVVISAEYKVMADHGRLTCLLTEKLEDMARRLNESGTFIGHIKASMDIHTVDVFSLTDTIGKWTRGASEEITLTLAVILFIIEESQAAAEVKSMLEQIHMEINS